MKASKMRDMTDSELQTERDELKRALFNMRLQRATGQLEKSHKLRETKKDLARVNTVIRARELNPEGDS